MPLSEHEQRQLEQIEQALYTDYPKLAQAVRAKDPRVHYRRRVAGAGIGFLLGVGLLLAGVVTTIIPMSIGGFVVMLVCAMWGVTSWRHMRGNNVSTRGFGRSRGQGAARGRGPRRGGGPRGMTPGMPRGRRVRGASGQQRFMERLEERWRRRQERGQF